MLKHLTFYILLDIAVTPPSEVRVGCVGNNADRLYAIVILRSSSNFWSNNDWRSKVQCSFMVDAMLCDIA